MAWNRSDGKEPNLRGSKTEASSLRKGLIASAVVAVVASIVMWTMLHSPKQRPTSHVSRPKTTTVKKERPAPISTNVVAKARSVTREELPPQEIGEIRNGTILLPNGELHKIKGIVTNSCANTRQDYEIFDHFSDNTIAGLLMHQPGDWMVGTPEWNGELTKDFLESLKTPIISTSEDTPFQKNLKKLVNEAKIELKAAHDRGEDIEQYLLNAREEFQKLSRYKNELRTMALDGIDGASTPEEVDDFIAAANKMLEDRGIAPLDDLSQLAKIKLRMDGTEIEEEGEK